MIPYIVPVTPSSGESIKLVIQQYPILFYIFLVWFVLFQLFGLYLMFDMFKHGDGFLEKFMPILVGSGLALMMFAIDIIIYNAMF